MWDLGPRSRPVYAALRERILTGQLAAGAKLRGHSTLAAEFGVAPVTLRQALGRLETEGLVSREQGRGTFVRARATPAVLIVDDEPDMRALLARHVTHAGYRVVEAAGPTEGLSALARDPGIGLVLSDVRMPEAADVVGFLPLSPGQAGVEFIRTVRRRWPELPLAAVTGYPDDLADLHGTPECPVLIVPKPFCLGQIEEVLRLALPPRAAAAAGAGDDPGQRAVHAARPAARAPESGA